MTLWARRARQAAADYSVRVDWDERFYICPECGEPVYEDDWQEEDLVDFICPICNMEIERQ